MTEKKVKEMNEMIEQEVTCTYFVLKEKYSIFGSKYTKHILQIRPLESQDLSCNIWQINLIDLEDTKYERK